MPCTQIKRPGYQAIIQLVQPTLFAEDAMIHSYYAEPTISLSFVKSVLLLLGADKIESLVLIGFHTYPYHLLNLLNNSQEELSFCIFLNCMLYTGACFPSRETFGNFVHVRTLSMKIFFKNSIFKWKKP